MAISAESILSFTPPVQQHSIPGFLPNIFLVREDLGPLIGGNKIRRLVHWCQNKEKFNVVHLLSDYGSHSHLALAKIFESGIFPWWEKIVLHERKVKKNPFRNALRNQYVNGHGIQINSMDNWVSWLKYFAFREKGHLFLPMGGAVKCRGIYENVLQLSIFKTLGKQTVFSVPVASGNSFKEIYETAKKFNIPGRFVCPITATSPKIFSMFLKKNQHADVSLFYPRKKSRDEYLAKSAWFKKHTGALADPIHGIFLLDVLEKFKNSKINLVFWITSARRDESLFPLKL